MLDVPTPHPAHTWRDFLIHIATICVGLLIAIGLEQTVEALHRRHESVDSSSRCPTKPGITCPSATSTPQLPRRPASGLALPSSPCGGR